jgi:hypothetical protein
MQKLWIILIPGRS